MRKYLEAIGRMCEESFAFILLSALVGVVLFFGFAILTAITNGLTLVAAVIWWVHIVYKEANKDET